MLYNGYEVLLTLCGKRLFFIGIPEVFASSVYSYYKRPPVNRRQFWSEDREDKPHYKPFIALNESMAKEMEEEDDNS